MITAEKLEKFQGGPTPPPNVRLNVTIDKNSVIRINRVCYRKLGNPTAVYLYYGREECVIGIEPVHSYRLPSAFPLKETTNGGWRINAAPFCRHYGIRIDSTERFVNPDFDANGKRLVMKLSETVTVKQQLRKGGTGK